MDDCALLACVPLFSSIDPACLAVIAGRLKPRTYRRGEVIFHKDDPGSTLYIIKTGQVKISTGTPEGEEAILAILADSDFFGELSILDGEPRSASAAAMETTHTLVLHRSDFLEVIHSHPELAKNVLTTMSHRLRRTDHLLEDSVFLDLPARLAKRLLELAEKHGRETDEGVQIDLRLTQQDLANVVGASRVAVNRLLGQFQDRGLLSIDRHRITIIHADALRERVY